jgi:hypothetical protein
MRGNSEVADLAYGIAVDPSESAQIRPADADFEVVDLDSVDEQPEVMFAECRIVRLDAAAQG